MLGAKEVGVVLLPGNLNDSLEKDHLSAGHGFV